MNGRFWHLNGIFGVPQSGYKGVVFAFFVPIRIPDKTKDTLAGTEEKNWFAVCGRQGLRCVTSAPAGVFGLICQRWQTGINNSLIFKSITLLSQNLIRQRM